MNTNEFNIEKCKYQKPEIEIIDLDHEISLYLQSQDTPPEFEGERVLFERDINNPYKSNLV